MMKEMVVKKCKLDAGRTLMTEEGVWLSLGFSTDMNRFHNIYGDIGAKTRLHGPYDNTTKCRYKLAVTLDNDSELHLWFNARGKYVYQEVHLL